ncbi:hypothetical protein CFC21_069142 [Triticum aestivum]|uniref:Uncharacterized protein n=3 Tax=Triticum TaxID=4564 RepID=A0A3B6B4J4_WHEAT|nr:uncharacterized protein LOC119351951 [Triticum dicoccoides]XP_044453758.1 uncharacterized protein LOC123186025 [Triticum aestivum]XP_048553277.1 uncharacterized protein LOC125534013 [Triticum urartu]KAF7062559.1 hypothetical protein CFC21_069142 [Triticum aestivum]
MGMAGDDWRCRKHPPVPCGGVCPHCLCDRLLRLCPDCARTRPCACASPSSPSSSASSASVGRVCSLIERERRIGRSRSVAGGGSADERRRSRVWGWASFRKPAAGKGMELESEEERHAAEDAAALELERSSSASAEKLAPKTGGWGRFLPGPIKALRHRKSRASAGASARGDRREGVR